MEKTEVTDQDQPPVSDSLHAEATAAVPGETAAVTAPAQQTTSFSIQTFLRGDLGALPVALTLILIAIFFQITSHGLFLSPVNLSDLVNQIAALGAVGLASVLVLLIGEIDLSLGVVSYTCASVTGVLSVYHNWPAIPALAAGLIAGAVIGLINGFFIAVLRVPSFIVTLAALLGYQGVVLHLLGTNTSLNIFDPTIANLATTYLPDYLGVGLPVIAVALYIGVILFARLRRQSMGLAVAPAWTMWTQFGVIVVLTAVILTLFEAYRGVPQSAMILLGFVALFWLILRFTGFGRHVYAVGGNAEAARRSGINVTGIRIAIFTLASMLAAVGGILAASRLDTASSEVDPTLLLNAIATAVIGGVSLFGGRGSVWAVVLGSLVIGGLANGLGLLNANTDIVYMVEGVVLLIAVTADALARRRSLASGR